MSKMLNAENLLAESGIDPSDTTLTADRLLYNHAIEQCQSAALDELFDNPGECVQRSEFKSLLHRYCLFPLVMSIREGTVPVSFISKCSFVLSLYVFFFN